MDEDRVEIVVNDQGDKVQLKHAISHLKAARYIFRNIGCERPDMWHLQVHPYEEVAYDVYKLEDV